MKGDTIMATEIKDTPILKGKDAERFLEAMSNPKPVSAKRKAEIRAAFNWFKSAACFPVL